ncbi:MAG: hypothetical protein KTR21_09305 [Rhodobacteraceae bacterium]|nr:hypothetical protein [Paracoccaceae bacterium]
MDDYTVAVNQLDQKYKCEIFEFYIALASIVKIIPSLQECIENGKLIDEYEISKSEVNILKKEFNITEMDESSIAYIRPLCEHDRLSYKVHTGRELWLMIEGEKPMAYFSRHESEDFSQFCQQPFFEYVSAQKIHYDTFTIAMEKGNLVYDVFYKSGEAWRVKTLEILKNILFNGVWSSEMLYIEGTLAGYSEDENMEFLRFEGVV